MTKAEFEEIRDTYQWIKVKRLGNESSYEELHEHHKEETEFLIAKCRELAKQLYDLEGTHSTLMVAMQYNRAERDELKRKLGIV